MWQVFWRQAAAGLRLLVVMTVVCGVVYPLVVWAVAQAAFGDRADGSAVRDADGRLIGSDLLGQDFDGPGWFRSRPGSYDAAAPGPSGLGPDSAVLLREVERRRAAVAEAEGVPAREVPPDALTGSGSGLDPHISSAYARLQVDRIARERGVARELVRELVEARVEGRVLGFLGQERVNVLELNRALLLYPGQGGGR